MPRHMALIREPALICDRSEAPVSPILPNQFLRPIDPQPDQIIMRRMARRGLELPCKMKRAEPGDFREFIERQRLRKPVLHQIDDA